MNIKGVAVEAVETTDVEVLKMLHSSRMDMQKFNMERSFAATVQTITLNIVIIGAYIGSKLQLTSEAKLLGSVILLSFNVSSVIYLYNKGRAHIKRRNEIAKIEDFLIIKFPSLEGDVTGSPATSNTFLKGSGVLMFGIIITCVCAIASFWIPLLVDEKVQESTVLKKAKVESEKLEKIR